jgi:hypothetical protein
MWDSGRAMATKHSRQQASLAMGPLGNQEGLIIWRFGIDLAHIRSMGWVSPVFNYWIFNYWIFNYWIVN